MQTNWTATMMEWGMHVTIVQMTQIKLCREFADAEHRILMPMLMA
jgi:hypothetical protein